jgi:hypothetical protein
MKLKKSTKTYCWGKKKEEKSQAKHAWGNKN